MDNLEIIRQVLAQHKVIFGQLKSTGESVSDMEALLRLETARADLTLGFQHTLSEKRDQLEKIISPLDRGLRKHYAFEEEMLPPLLGPALTEALKTEHRDLLSEMQKMIFMLNNTRLEGLSHLDEISQEAIMSNSLRNLQGQKLDHQKREEALLLTLQLILEEKAKKL